MLGPTMEKFVRLTETTASSGTNYFDIVPEAVVRNEKNLGEILRKAPERDWYTSVYYYSKDAKEFFDKNKNFKNYNGVALSNKLVFDLDNKDVEKAKKDTQELLHRLHREGVNIELSGKVYFSGHKGFHVEVYLNKEFTPEQLKTICTNIAGDLESFDPKVYNSSRLFRLPNTKHQETGLYKIELYPNDIVESTIEDIKTAAKTKGTILSEPKLLEDLAFLDKYSKDDYKKPAPIKVEVDDLGVSGLATIDFTKCPKSKPRCIFALEHGVMKPGERNDIFYRLATYYANQGYTKDVAYNILKGIARENAILYPNDKPVKKDEIYNTVISSVYCENGKYKVIPGATGFDPGNELIKKYCDMVSKHTNKPCCAHGHLAEDKTTVQIDEVFSSFNNFAENFDKNLVKTGIGFVDQHMKIATGTTTLLVGAAGSGKTTVCLNMMERANAFDQQTMFFSMDMHKNLIYLKLAQKLTNYNQEQILKFHKTRDTKKIEEIRGIIKDNYGKTFFDFSSTLTLEQMRDKIFDVEQKTGKKIKLVAIDYASRISCQYSDSYAAARHNALKSKEMADVTDSAWIILSQISRNVGDGSSPIRTKRAAKESGDWEESATNVITLWRPFMGDPNNDDIMRMYLAKNRMGRELEAPLFWDGSKGIVRDMDSLELDEYNATRGDKAEREYFKNKSGKTFIKT